MAKKIESVVRFLVRPRTIFFLVALLNFPWFFFHSRIFDGLGSGSANISFCAVCPWWWDWSFTNAASLSLFATMLMLSSRRMGYFAAMIFSGFAVLDGIRWVSDASGFSTGIAQRYQVFSEIGVSDIQNLLDIQYLLAAIIFMTAATCFTKSFFAKAPPSEPSFP